MADALCPELFTRGSKKSTGVRGGSAEQRRQLGIEGEPCAHLRGGRNRLGEGAGSSGGVAAGLELSGQFHAGRGEIGLAPTGAREPGPRLPATAKAREREAEAAGERERVAWCMARGLEQVGGRRGIVAHSDFDEREIDEKPRIVR